MGSETLRLKTMACNVHSASWLMGATSALSTKIHSEVHDLSNCAQGTAVRRHADWLLAHHVGDDVDKLHIYLRERLLHVLHALRQWTEQPTAPVPKTGTARRSPCPNREQQTVKPHCFTEKSWSRSLNQDMEDMQGMQDMV